MNSVMGTKRNFKGKWALILDKRTVCDLKEDRGLGEVTESREGKSQMMCSNPKL